MLTTNANHTVCGHCGGSVKDSCCWMNGKAYHNSCYSLLMGVERGIKSVCTDKDSEIASLRATISRLREYAVHKEKCFVRAICYNAQGKLGSLGLPCNCGYDDLIKEIGE